MLFTSIIQNYLLWHYSRAFMEIFHVWLNFLWFIVNFFSIPQLIKSWFSPWKRIVEGRGRKFNIEDLAGFIIIGIISRLIGFIMRTVVISIGLLSLLIVTLTGFATYVFWVGAPFVLIGLLGYGITLIVV